jgi:hypothetical protein
LIGLNATEQSYGDNVNSGEIFKTMKNFWKLFSKSLQQLKITVKEVKSLVPFFKKFLASKTSRVPKRRVTRQEAYHFPPSRSESHDDVQGVKLQRLSLNPQHGT